MTDKEERVILGFMVRKEYQYSGDCRGISERTYCLQIKIESGNLSVLNIHAPTEEKGDDKDCFHGEIQSACTTLPTQDIKIVINDLVTLLY